MANQFIASGFIDKPIRLINQEYAKKLTKDLQKTLNIKDTVNSQEINTFLVHSGKLENSLTIDNPKIEKTEQLYTQNFKIYYQKYIESVLKNNMKSNPELKETAAIIKNFLNVIDPSTERTFTDRFNKLTIELPSILHEITLKNQVIIWSLNESGFYRFVLNAYSEPVNVSTKELTKPIDLYQVVDKFIMLNFFESMISPTLQRLEKINEVLKEMVTFIADVPRMHTFDQKARNKMDLFLRIMIAKMSALQQTNQMLKRIFYRFTDLEHKLQEEVLKEEVLKQQLNTFLAGLDERVSRTQKLLQTVNDKIKFCEVRFRDYNSHMTTANLTDQNSLLDEYTKILKKLGQLSVGLFIESEYIKIWGEFFRDIPNFIFSTENFTDQKVLRALNVEADIIIAARGLFKTYKLGTTTIYALQGINLDVKKGEFLIIYGSSGAGKTTLLNCLAGLDTPDRGVVLFHGKDLHLMSDKERSKIRLLEMGFIFQNYALLAHYTAKENVGLPAEIAGLSKDLRTRIEDLLKGVGIDNQAKQYPSQLSGGQMQRVSIARALTNRPSVIFADEPTGDLDSQTGKVVMELLKKFHDETKTTIILITHDESLISYATRVIRIRDGNIIDKDVVH